MQSFPVLNLSDMAYAYELPQSHADFKQQPQDFQVNEVLSFDIEGEGTHAYLYVQKTNTNTQWLAKQLAKFAQIHERDVGYAGLKDRHAVTRQWFSINLEGIEEPDWKTLDIEGVKLERVTYHRRKLKTGAIAYNEFIIVLKNIAENSHPELEKKLNLISQQGVPNYFGPQRFGIDNHNLNRAGDWFSGQVKVKRRDEKSLYISAARSMLFNQLLSQRIKRFGWNQLIQGEVMMLDGSHAVFCAEPDDNSLQQRFESSDIHPTASLWGRGQAKSQAEVKLMEDELGQQFPDWCQALENKGLKQERRSIRLLPAKLSYEFNATQELILRFNLPTGSYATSLLRELVSVET